MIPVRTVLSILAVLLLTPLVFATQASALDNPASPDEQTPAVTQGATPEGSVDTAADETDQDSFEFEQEGEVVHIADPLYPWNNAMYHFNDKLYFWVLKPVSKGYRAVIPEDVRIATGNFFSNLTTPIRFVSSVLQFKLGNAGNELLRFVYNSTAGVIGLADAAKTDLHIARRDEDLGQTLGAYGIGHGVYLVWPFFGPSSVRDTVGMVGDAFLDPVYYISPWEASLGVEAYDKVNDTSFRIGDYEALIDASLDPYVAIRDAYVQHRNRDVRD